MTRPGGAIQWANEHNSHFEFSKLALIDFTLSSVKAASSLPLQLPTTLVTPSPSTQYLGVLFDPHLSWKPQRLYALCKGTSYISTLH
jgi:hypothetical protein